MPIVFPIEAGFLVLAAAFGALILSRTAKMWLRPLLLSLQHPHGAWWRKLLLRTAAAVVSATLYVENKVQAALSHFAEPGLHLLARFLAGTAAMFHWLFKELEAIPHSTADALKILRHETMPKAIHRSVAPVKATAAHAGALAGRAAAGERANRRSISGVSRKLGALAGLLLGADLFVFGAKHGGHAHLHHRHHTRDIPQVINRDIPRLKGKTRAHDHDISNLRARVKRIEKALGLGIIAGIVVRTLAKVAPWIFCRNVKRVARQLCGTNSNLIDDLLMGTIAIGGALSIVELAKELQTVMGPAVEGIEELITEKLG